MESFIKISVSERIFLTVLSIAMVVISLLNWELIVNSFLLLGMFITACKISLFQVGTLVYNTIKK